MAIRFQCPHCQAVRSLHTRMMGREIRCPECETLVTIPSQEQIDEAKRQRQADRQFLEMASQTEKQLQRNLPAADSRRPSPSPSAAASAKAAAGTAAATSVRPPIDDEIDEEPMVERRSMPHDHVDMTPMVDITFLLLIFFMSTANFTLQKSLEVPVQKEQKASTRAVQQVNDETQDSVTVQIDEFNAYLVLMPDGTDREAASKPDLMLALEDARVVSNAEPPDKLIIEAHRDCTHKAVVTALDAGRDKNFEKFQVTVVDEIQ